MDSKLKCRCGVVVTRGVYNHGVVYCSDECADKQWIEKGADNWARQQSEGEFENFEEYMESKGATIADDHYVMRREQ